MLNMSVYKLLLVACLLLCSIRSTSVFAQRHRQQQRNRATAPPRTTATAASGAGGKATTHSADQATPNATTVTADAVDNIDSYKSEGEMICPRPCGDDALNTIIYGNAGHGQSQTTPRQRAIQAFWSNNMIRAEACACLALQLNREDNLAQAVRYEAMHSPFMPSAYRLPGMVLTAPRPQSPTPYTVLDYEVLGPIPIGKLEMDADSTFVAYENSKRGVQQLAKHDHRRRGQNHFNNPGGNSASGNGRSATPSLMDVLQLQRIEYSRFDDPITYLLAQPSSSSSQQKLDSTIKARGDNNGAVHELPVFSEFVANGVTGGWRGKKASGGSGQLDIQWPDVSWQNLVSGLSSTSVTEFQGWVRAITYAASAGSYVLSCQGTHTVYIRNNNMTRLLVGDVYSAGGVDNGLEELSAGLGIAGSSSVLPLLQSRVVGSVHLKAGVVGLVMPVRGVTRASASCHIKLADWGTTGSTSTSSSGSAGGNSNNAGSSAGTRASQPAQPLPSAQPLAGVSISAGGAEVSLLPSAVKYVPEMVEWEYTSDDFAGNPGFAGAGPGTNKGFGIGGAVNNHRPKSTGMGLLLSNVVMLPIHNLLTETVVVSVALELSDALASFLGAVSEGKIQGAPVQGQGQGHNHHLPAYITNPINSSILSIRPVTLESLSNQRRRTSTYTYHNQQQDLDDQEDDLLYNQESYQQQERGGRAAAGVSAGDGYWNMRGGGATATVGLGTEMEATATGAVIKIAPGQTMGVPLQLYRTRVSGRNIRGHSDRSSGRGVAREHEEENEEQTEGEYPVDGEQESSQADDDDNDDDDDDDDNDDAEGVGDRDNRKKKLSNSWKRRKKRKSIEDEPLFLPCGGHGKGGSAAVERTGSFVYYIVLSPSRGNQIKVPFEINCRRKTESVLVSYLDHDGSVTQAAVIFPLISDSLAQKAGQQYAAQTANRTCVAGGAAGVGIGAAAAVAAVAPHWMDIAHREMTRRYHEAHHKEFNKDFESSTPVQSEPESESESEVVAYNEHPCRLPYLHKDYPIYPGCYPVLFSLHGSGSQARNQADAYKRKLGKGETNMHTHTLTSPAGEYLYGVNNYFVVTPTRFGAHNWETVGGKSALHIMSAFARLMERFSPFLPQVRPTGHMIAGHSMGAHGALLAATAKPSLVTCASFTAGWLRKENYGGGNEFQRWDYDESLIDPSLKALLELNLADYHPDRLISNLQLLKYVHVRVGKNDGVTPSWYSRRLVRLLRERFGPGSVALVSEIGGGDEEERSGSAPLGRDPTSAAGGGRAGGIGGPFGSPPPPPSAPQHRKSHSKFADRVRASAAAAAASAYPTHTRSSRALDASRLELANSVLDEHVLIKKLRALFAGNMSLVAAAAVIAEQDAGTPGSSATDDSTATSTAPEQFVSTAAIDERVYLQQQLVPRVILEEMRDKDHWWWDTDTENDGGVLNDFTMRVLYSKCYEHSVLQQWSQWFISSMHRVEGMPVGDEGERGSADTDPIPSTTGRAPAANTNANVNAASSSPPAATMSTSSLSDVEAATDEPSQQLDLLSLVFNHSAHLSQLSKLHTRGGDGDPNARWLVQAEANGGGRSSAVSGRSKASAEAARLLAQQKAMLKDSHAADEFTARRHMKRERLEKHQQSKQSQGPDSTDASNGGGVDGSGGGGGGGRGGNSDVRGDADADDSRQAVKLNRVVDIDAAHAIPALSPVSAQIAALGAHQCYGLLTMPSDLSSPSTTSFEVSASSSALTHSGTCGIQILQQQRSLSPSSIRVDCFSEYPSEQLPSNNPRSSTSSSTASDWSSYEAQVNSAATMAEQVQQNVAVKRREGLVVPLVTCSLVTENVKRFRILFNSLDKAYSPHKTGSTTGPTSAAEEPLVEEFEAGWADGQEQQEQQGQQWRRQRSDLMPLGLHELSVNHALVIGEPTRSVQAQQECVRNIGSARPASCLYWRRTLPQTAEGIRYMDLCVDSTTASTSATGTFAWEESTEGEYSQHKGRVCTDIPVNSLLEKTALVAGPIREVYARPLVVVVGTLQNKKASADLRVAGKELASYFANAVFGAYDSTVTVMTDVAYLAYIAGLVEKQYRYDHVSEEGLHGHTGSSSSDGSDSSGDGSGEGGGEGSVGSSNARVQQLFPNIVCIGSPQTNKVMKMLHEQQRHARAKFNQHHHQQQQHKQQSDGTYDQIDRYHEQVLYGLQQQGDDVAPSAARGLSGSSGQGWGQRQWFSDATRHTLLGNLPVQFIDGVHTPIYGGAAGSSRGNSNSNSYGNSNSNTVVGGSRHTESDSVDESDTPDGFGFRLLSSGDGSAGTGGGVVVEQSYTKKHHALLFAFPLQLVVRSSASATSLFSASALAVCIHSNSNEFISLSRWMWPTVPPMVRAPLEINSLDFVVLDTRQLFSRGYGAVLATGVWDQHWRAAAGDGGSSQFRENRGSRGRNWDREINGAGEGISYIKSKQHYYYT